MWMHLEMIIQRWSEISEAVKRIGNKKPRENRFCMAVRKVVVKTWWKRL